MAKKKKISTVQVKSFAGAEQAEVEDYANTDWQESVRNVEAMRQMIWSKEYLLDRDKSISIRSLSDDSYEFE
ncbi:MAG: hypothetical protein ABJB11_10250 [Ferruginibacter sp.]